MSINKTWSARALTTSRNCSVVGVISGYETAAKPTTQATTACGQYQLPLAGVGLPAIASSVVPLDFAHWRALRADTPNLASFA
jgi:hypothetical protein